MTVTNIGPDLREWLMGRPLDPSPRERVHHNVVPERFDGPYLWFARRGLRREDTFDPAEISTPFEVVFDLEAIALDGRAFDLAASVRRQNTYRGAFGGGTVQAVLVGTQADDYTPRGLMSDEALQWAALEIRVLGYEPAA